MKFISKNINLRVVLSHGIPSEPITGRQAVPGLYVKFEDGIANINDEGMIEKMKAHPGFNSDFIVAENEQPDPYSTLRREKEPSHQITELKYGTFDKSTSSKQASKYTSDQLAMIKTEAIKIAKEMLKEVLQKEDKDVGRVGTPESKKESNFVCDCGFVAKSNLGLTSHKRFCKKTTGK